MVCLILSFLLIEGFFFMQSFHFADGKLVQRTELNSLDAKYQLRWSSACLLTYNPWLVTPSQLPLLLLLLSRFSRVRLFAVLRTVADQVLCPWNSLGKNTGADCHFLLQEIYLTQQSNPGVLHCRKILYHLSHQRNLNLALYQMN